MAVEEKINEYRKHRLEREKQIIEVLKLADGQGTVEAIFPKLYPDVKDERIAFVAKGNIKVHLKKLIDEGVVIETDDEKIKTEKSYKLAFL